ncbi:TetR/AcrR family transcriptional regulator [Paenibacillus nanensis]|uniref:TetR/AcrR family transcriptional regulator n=1 Tax=Paenibacillus nanensis TaxID=393251 RepID=A0A3A1UUY4_9BACL|nr:TetR/AcrR family transcriptional regulator [Paenibacillus nanensis]RIX52025.1 TetR/AcrR family transcriptional regulator [Paenibacillus nanensis]
MVKSVTDRRVLRSKQALKEALLSLMARKSFSSISITEIVELANYNRGTFYTHYENKEALLDDVLGELIDELIAAFRAPYDKVELFRVDEMSANSVKIFEHIYSRKEIYSVLFHSDVLPMVKEKMFAAIKRISIEDLEHAPQGKLNPELMHAYSMHALMGLVFYWIEGGFQYPPEYMQEQLVEILHYRPTAARTHLKK